MTDFISISEESLLECSNLYIKVFNSEPWNDNWTKETAYRRLNDIYLTPNFYGILYKTDNKIKGAIFGNYEQFYDGIHYNLREMFVSNEVQGQGIGSKLLNELEGDLKKLGITTIILFTSKGNKTNKFYQKNNYKAWDDMTLMGKDI